MELERKKMKGRPKELSQEPKEREAKPTHLQKNGTKNGRPEEENFVNKQVSLGIQHIYPASTKSNQASWMVQSPLSCLTKSNQASWMVRVALFCQLYLFS
jgi:hypothetical protein